MLLVGLSRRHPVRHRVFAGIWLSACTYPILWLVLPQLIDPARHQALYLGIGETFVPAAECTLFWLAFGKAEPRSRVATVRDVVAVTVANVISFVLGEVYNDTVDWRWLG